MNPLVVSRRLVPILIALFLVSILVPTLLPSPLMAQEKKKEKGDVRITKRPKLKTSVEAEYTDDAIKNKIEGKVKLRLTISALGKVEKVEILERLGHGLDESAKKAAEQFVFEPAEINNIPSAVVLSFTIDFSMPILPATLKGKVIDSQSGKPVGAFIQIKYLGSDYDPVPEASSKTDVDGTFEFGNIPPGKYSIDVKVERYQDFKSEVDLPGGKVSEIDYKVMARAVNLVGAVQESGTRKPLAGVTVRLFSEGIEEAVAEGFTTADGRFGFRGVKSGEYTIAFEAEGYFNSSTLIKVNDGEIAGGTYSIQAQYYDEYRVETKAKKTHTEISRRKIGLEEVRRIPGTGNDIVRVVQNLPGVARAPFVSGLIVVRGAAPQDTKISIDGDNIPLVYHFLGGPAVINSEMIDSLEFFPGNFSTYYGRATGGIIDLSTRSPKTDRIHGMVDVDLLDASVLVEGPINDDFSFALSGRRSYFDVFLPLLLPDDGPDITVFPRYYDYQGWFTYKGIEDHTLELMVYGSDDKLDLLFPKDDPQGTREFEVPGINFGNSFLRGNFKWEWDPRYPIENKFMISYGINQTAFDAGNSLFFENDFLLAQIRNDTRIKVSEEVTVRLGVDNAFGSAKVRFSIPAFSEAEQGRGNASPPNFGENGIDLEVKQTFLMPAAYIEPEISLFEKKLLLVPGIRVDHYGQLADTVVSPRFSFRWDFVDKFTAKGGVGLFTQFPLGGSETEEFGNPDVLSEKAIQYALGTEYKPSEYLEFDLTLFYRDMFDLVVPTDRQVEVNGKLRPLRFVSEGEGRAYGAEVLIRHYPHRRFFGWLAYTLSRSERLNALTGNFDTYQFDQTHILTLVGGYNLPANWDISARFRLTTGNPQTPVIGGVFNSDASRYQRVQGEPFSERAATFHQLDLRVDKKFVFDSWILGAYLDVQNVYNQVNEEGIRYNYDFTESQPVQGLPLLPTIGLSAQF